MNLIINGLDATPQGGRVTVSAEKNTVEARVVIEDTGPGVSEEIRERIFEPFFTTKVQGSGLGLWIVHAILDRHGGNIELRGRPGAGACFEVTLPLVTAPARA
jgi:signal transduction histidine kinase